MSDIQDALLARLMAGDFGPWGGQAFVGTDAISILRPDTMQWETIRGTAGGADLTESVLGPTVQMGSTLEWANEDDMGLSGYGSDDQNVVLGLTPQVGSGMGGGIGHPQTSVVSASNYSYLDFVRTELGEIRLTEGISNGSTGPLSPIRNGPARDVVDANGVPWLPVVRMNGIDAERRDGARGPGGMW